MRIEAKVTHALEGITIELDGGQAQRLQRIMADLDNGWGGSIAHEMNRKLVLIFEKYGFDHYTPFLTRKHQKVDLGNNK